LVRRLDLAVEEHKKNEDILLVQDQHIANLGKTIEEKDNIISTLSLKLSKKTADSKEFCEEENQLEEKLEK
jgi:hypothetical protein